MTGKTGGWILGSWLSGSEMQKQKSPRAGAGKPESYLTNWWRLSVDKSKSWKLLMDLVTGGSHNTGRFTYRNWTRFPQQIWEKNLLRLLVERGERNRSQHCEINQSTQNLTSLTSGKMTYLEPNLLGYYQSLIDLGGGTYPSPTTLAILFHLSREKMRSPCEVHNPEA